MLKLLMLICLSLTGVHCGLDLSQSGSVVVKPGESLTLTCKVSGYSLTDSTNVYGVAWIRQPVKKALEWILNIYYDGSSNSQSSLNDRFSVTRDVSSSTVTLKVQSLQPEDTALYYCARYHNGTNQQQSWTKTSNPPPINVTFQTTLQNMDNKTFALVYIRLKQMTNPTKYWI